MMLLTAVAMAADEPAAESPEGKPALVVMDIQNAYLPLMDDEDKELALMMVNATIELFRAHDLPVIRVYHTDPDRGPAPGSEGFEFPSTIRVKPDDPKVVKNHPSAFKKTELEKILREQGCDTVFLCGLSATGCVLYTYFDAEGLELRTFMVRNALLSHSAELTDAVEEITGAVGYGAIEYMLLGATR
jgi:nicotinamidase-related amidase